MEDRIKAPSRKLYKLEAIRGFAAVYVVFYHLFASGIKIFNKDFSILFRFGQEAVILFFVLSGFVIYYSFEKSVNKTFSFFFKKRFLRIYIPVIIVFITNYILLSYYNRVFFEFDFKELIGNLLMFQDLEDKRPNVLVGPFLENIPLWSLSYEWYFYLVFFIVYKWFNFSSIRVYSFGILFTVLYVYYPAYIFRELMYFVIWWVGVDFAKLYLDNENIDFQKMKLSVISIFIICLILFFNILSNGAINQIFKSGGISEYPWIEFRHFLFTFLVIICAVLWNKLKWFGFDFIFRPFVFIAPISFGIYISHWFLVCNAKYFDFIDKEIIRLICYLLVCLVFSYLLEIVLFPRINKIFMNSKMFIFFVFSKK